MAEMQDLEGSEEIGEIEAVEQQDAAKELKESVVAALPDKYKGKSLEDLAKMHQEAEKLIDRQGREVGEIRKLADELIKSQLAKQPVVKEEPEEVDFFTNPREAIRREVEGHPKVRMAEQYAAQARMTQAQQAVLAKHPDMTQVIADPEFVNWVKGSRVRLQLFQQADAAYDADAADELLSTYKALYRKQPAAAQQEVRVDKESRDQMLKSAAVERGGSGESGKKIYRRSDIIQLSIRNPAKFAAMKADIDLAYAEGRVK